MPSIDLTGLWLGHYFQRGQAHPISAWLNQDADHVTGSMRDGHPQQEFSVFEAAAEAGLAPGADEQIEARVKEMVPGATGPVRYVAHLPTDSALEGGLRGNTVSFLKTYQGPSFGGYRVGDQFVGMAHEGHSVHYEGTLSADGLVIDGLWWIDPDPPHTTRRTEGEFQLRREDGPPTNPTRQAERPARPWWKRWR